MAMQAGKIQLVHYSAAREYGLKPGHAQLTRFFRDQIDAALFDGCDAQPEIWNGFQRLCLADDVESKVTLPDVARLGGPFARAVIEQQDDVAFLNAHHGDEVMGRSEEHTSELQSLMRISYAVFCLKKKKKKT